VQYREFFSLATGFDPFPFQVNFHKRDRSISTYTLTAPTGLGKTECLVVDWLHGILYDRQNTPTRLVFCLPMRSLTHQTGKRVETILKRLNHTKITVHSLVGGTGTLMDREWLDAIDRPCIVLGTQDQILSRQLFRGYACSRWEWAIHGALLNNDVRIVMDETQLMGIGYLTSLILQQQRLEKGCYGRSELILCSATLDTAPMRGRLTYGECRISEKDYIHKLARKKLGMQKKLQRVAISTDYVSEIATFVVAEHLPDTLSLCIVNRVQDAISIADAIKKLTNAPILLLHSRFRGYDRIRLAEKLDGFRGIVVATQVVEAGIDLDARKLFTVACPWASFVQRCGRAGRNGTYCECDVFLLEREQPEIKPYEHDEIRDFYKRVDRLQSASIADLLNVTPPHQTLRGGKLDRGKLNGLFDSHPGIKGDQVQSFIRSEIDLQVLILWRDFQDTPDGNPNELEACRVKKEDAIKFLSNCQYFVWDSNAELWVEGGVIDSDVFVCVSQSSGGYSDSLGFTGDTFDIATVLPQMKVSGSGQGWRRSQNVTLTQHSIDALGFAQLIVDALGEMLNEEIKDLVTRAAQWHDYGKAHLQFQAACGRDNELWAKRTNMGKYHHPGFRHELASAIGALVQGEGFELAYLVAAHHGKCRVRISNFSFIENQVGLRGILDGDELPAVDLGEGLKLPAIALELPDPATWHEAAQGLLEDWGAFRLGFLEAIVRIADWRASNSRLL